MNPYYKQGRAHGDARNVLDAGMVCYDPEAKPQSFDAVHAYHVAAFGKGNRRSLRASLKEAA